MAWIQRVGGEVGLPIHLDLISTERIPSMVDERWSRAGAMARLPGAYRLS
jgi:hypothetical protein